VFLLTSDRVQLPYSYGEPLFLRRRSELRLHCCGRETLILLDQAHFEGARATPGMVAFVSPGKEHWHGDTKDSAFAHLTILGQPHELKILEK
jgi:hypothetical protein